MAKRATVTVKYHGRAGKPLVHTTRTGRQYIMVRAPGGGVKRLYSGTRYYEEPTGPGKKTWRRLRLS